MHNSRAHTHRLSFCKYTTTLAAHMHRKVANFLLVGAAKAGRQSDRQEGWLDDKLEMQKNEACLLLLLLFLPSQIHPPPPLFPHSITPTHAALLQMQCLCVHVRILCVRVRILCVYTSRSSHEVKLHKGPTQTRHGKAMKVHLEICLKKRELETASKENSAKHSTKMKILFPQLKMQKAARDASNWNYTRG